MTPVTPRELSLEARALITAGLELHHALSARSGLAPQDVAALLHLLDDGPLAPRVLGERLSLRPSSVTELIERGSARGHLRRMPHPTDRRSYLVAVTRSGTASAFSSFRPLLPALHAAADAVPPDARPVVSDYLRATAAALRDHVRSSPQPSSEHR